MSETGERWHRITDVFNAARLRPPRERDAFLASACGTDSELRLEVAGLLAADDVAASDLIPSILESGFRIGDFEVLSFVAAGAMGQVYRAHDTSLDRDVALKILPLSLLANPDRRARFDREAKLLASLNHPHIATIYRVVEEDGIVALALELVEGETLAERIRRGKLPVRDALLFAKQIAEALEAAHQQGIVHRDLKPANIKITANGDVKVLDFGLAKREAAFGPGSEAHQTMAGAVVGTPSYMSPEHLRGNAADKRADIWAFGCILYEMLTGRVAFAGVGGEGLFDTFASVLGRDPEWAALPRKVPATVRQLLNRCLEKDPARRLPDITEAKVALEKSLAQRTIRLPSVAAVAAVVGIGIVTLAGAYAFLRPRSTADPFFSSAPRQVTFAPGWEAEPALSPAGDLVAFSANDSGRTNLWVVDARGGNPVRITAGDGDDLHPAWFPDGSAIAYVVARGGRENIWRTAPLGGSSTLLVPDAGDPAVSPDGTRIAFARRSSSSLYRIWMAPVEEPNRATMLTNDYGGGLWDHRTPVWSPNGRTICYAAHDGLWLVDVRSNTMSRLTDAVFDRDPAWSADGRFIYFASIREGTEALWKVPAGGGDPVRLTIGAGPERQPAIARDGKRLAYSTQTSSSDITLLQLTSGAEVRLASNRDEVEPTFSPDGRALVFTSNRWNGRYDLWLQPILGGKPDGAARRLTDHPGAANYTSFSPDARWLAYGRNTDGRRDIWVTPTTGGLPVRVTTGIGMHYHPAWSPDGGRIAYVTGVGSTYRLEYVHVTAGHAVDSSIAIATLASEIDSPAWSPDARRLAFVTNGEVWIVGTDGAQMPRQITKAAGAQRVRWNRRSGHLFASGFWGSDRKSIRTIDEATGAAAPLGVSAVLGPDVLAVDFDISPDETVAAVQRGDFTGDIWVLDIGSK